MNEYYKVEESLKRKEHSGKDAENGSRLQADKGMYANDDREKVCEEKRQRV